jgi:hypothetical protein
VAEPEPPVKAAAVKSVQEPGVTVATTVADPPTEVDPSRPIGAVLPGEEVRRRPERPVEVERRPLAPGEEPCRSCGTGNTSERRFCRSCGAELRPAAGPAARPSWWRRTWRALVSRRSFEAGQRRKTRQPVRVPRKLIVLLTAVVLAGVAVGPARPLVNSAVTAIKDRIADHVPVTPTKVRASSARAGSPPERITDRAANKFWAPAGKAEGAWIEADLGKAVRLLDVVVTGGQAADAEQFQKQGRPNQIELSLVDSRGATTVRTIGMQDKAGPQKFEIKADDVVRVRLTVKSAYGMAANRYLAIAEVEFFARG